MFGYSAASFGNSYAATEGANANGSVGAGGLASLRGGAGGDPYAWAQRLRDIPDEDVLAELSMMGFTDASMQSRRGGGGGERARAGHSNNGVKRVAGAGAASRCWSHVHAAFPTPHLAQPSPPCSLHALSMLSPCSLHALTPLAVPAGEKGFSFANGTGSSKKKRRNSVGRAISPPRRR